MDVAERNPRTGSASGTVGQTDIKQHLFAASFATAVLGTLVAWLYLLATTGWALLRGFAGL